MIKRFLSKLTSIFQGGFKNLFNVLVPIVQSNAGQLIDKALPIAIGIVTELALNQALPSADKRSAALSALKAALITQGLATASQASTSVLSLIIELAVSHLKVTSPPV